LVCVNVPNKDRSLTQHWLGASEHIHYNYETTLIGQLTWLNAGVNSVELRASQQFITSLDASQSFMI